MRHEAVRALGRWLGSCWLAAGPGSVQAHSPAAPRGTNPSLQESVQAGPAVAAAGTFRGSSCCWPGDVPLALHRYGTELCRACLKVGPSREAHTSRLWGQAENGGGGEEELRYVVR